jgi:hypothetical protein
MVGILGVTHRWPEDPRIELTKLNPSEGVNPFLYTSAESASSDTLSTMAIPTMKIPLNWATGPTLER